MIRVLKCAHPRYSWEVKWYEGGKRMRRYFTAQGLARDFAAAKKRELAQVAPAESPLTAEERRAVARARALGVSLEEAVEAFGRRNAARERSLGVEELVARRLKEALRENLSPRYGVDLRRTLEGVAVFFAGRNVAELSMEDAAGWIYSGGLATATVRKRRAMLSGLFEFGRRLGVLEGNPAHLVKPPRETAAAGVTVLSPEEARRILLAVATVSPGLLAAEAIGLFAGLRRAEIERLDWGAVQLERGFIEVSAGIAKTRARRLVEIEPALAWILAQVEVPAPEMDKKSGLPVPRPVLPPNARRLRDRALKEAGWLGDKHGSGAAREGARPWPENALRHSYVSYHLALYNDVARTELQAGHDRKVLFRHYRELVTPGEAAEFWAAHLVLA